MSTLIQRLIIETRDRAQYNSAEPVNRLRGSRHLGALLLAELDWMPMKYDPEFAKKYPLESEEFQFYGITVKCDLPTDIPTVIAQIR